MSLKLNLTKLINRKCTPSASPASQNPYVDRTGKKIWNDRYLNLSKARQHWQVAFFSLVVVTLILLALVFRLSTQSKIKPVVVELNRGIPIRVAPITDTLPEGEKLIQFAITQFIIHARTVVSDTEAEKLLLDQTYAFSAEDTLRFLRDYYTHQNPFERASHCSVQVIILNTLKIGAKTWQVTWDEMESSKGGEGVTSQSRFLATLTAEQSEPNPTYLNDNPFGIYVTHLSWAKIQ
jgi:type IV secretory pathway TrbF-like protein